MSTTATTEAPTTETPVVETTPEEPELGDAGKKAIAAERARADAAEKALKSLQAAEKKRADAELSELERLQKERDELLTGKQQSELEAIRFKVALEKGLPADLAGRLKGDDYDALAADADSLAALVATKPTPQADPSQGAKPAVGAGTPGSQFESFIKSQLGH